MKNLSVHCLCLGNEEATIRTLTAAQSYAKQLIAGDTANSDRLKHFCTTNRIRYVKVSVNESLAECQNQLVACSDMPWHLFLQPGEEVNNPGKISEITGNEPAVYRLPCLQGDWLNKEVRLFHRAVGCSFSNPVFESVDYDKAQFLEAYVTGGTGGLHAKAHDLLTIWSMKQPLSIQPRYYTTLTYLMEGKQTAFVNAAQSYLFADPVPSTSNIMLRYYLACSLMNKPHTRKEAARHVMTCLAANLLMAEFWCLLGDMCYVESSFDRAKAFYRNGMVLGSRRRKDDHWPMHVTKYKKHPETLIAACDEAAAETFKFKAGSSRGSAAS